MCKRRKRGIKISAKVVKFSVFGLKGIHLRILRRMLRIKLSTRGENAKLGGA
jgi:hypothetical protein